MIQYREAMDGQVRDVDESKRQVQVVIPHERLDTYNTDFARECFRASFEQMLPKMAWMHIKTEPIGHAIRAQVTPAANELIAQFSDFDAVPRSRQAFIQIQDEDITDFSFGFDRAVAEPHPSVKGAVRFREARMKEISPVMTGAIPGAVAVGVREAADVTGVAELFRDGAISKEEARALLQLAGTVPTIGDRDDEDEKEPDVDKPERERIEIQQRDDTGQFAAATRTALAQGLALLDGVDLASLPDAVRSAIELFDAADVAAEQVATDLGVTTETAGQRARIGFKKLTAMLAAKGAHNPAALAAYIGKKKYGAAGMKAKAAAGRVKKKTREDMIENLVQRGVPEPAAKAFAQRATADTLTDQDAETQIKELGVTDEEIGAALAEDFLDSGVDFEAWLGADENEPEPVKDAPTEAAAADGPDLDALGAQLDSLAGA